jgi:sugar/nucleoside kinase (ribokinase family)
MKRWIGAGKKLVVCTHGKKGATALLSDGSWIETPIIDTYAFKDANGAGDSFFSGFLYGHLKGREVEQCMQLGTICAGLCITSSELAFEELSEELLEKAYEAYRNQS